MYTVDDFDINDWGRMHDVCAELVSEDRTWNLGELRTIFLAIPEEDRHHSHIWGINDTEAGDEIYTYLKQYPELLDLPSRYPLEYDCGSCDAKQSVFRCVQVKKWQYGDGRDAPAQHFQASVPVYTCVACEESFLHWQAERITDTVTMNCVEHQEYPEPIKEMMPDKPGRYVIHHPSTFMPLEQRAFEMWAVHPLDLDWFEMDRLDFYLEHLRAAAKYG
jgi:hypothetical protein